VCVCDVSNVWAVLSCRPIRWLAMASERLKLANAALSASIQLIMDIFLLLAFFIILGTYVGHVSSGWLWVAAVVR
jgi:hypothetical protein